MKLATVELLRDVLPHPNADRLEIAKVLGWDCVVKKGEFRAGDLVVFIPIDTVLPHEAEWASFLKDSKQPDKPIRLKTARLRGVYSQGLVLPATVLNGEGDLAIGEDVGPILGVKKYEKEIPAQLAGIALGGFPAALAAPTDEDNGLSDLDLVAEVLAETNAPWDLTLKLDGSSATVIVLDGKINQVCSRRLSLKESDENAFWKAAKKLEIPPAWSGVIQGELMGPGIQGNQLGLSEAEIFIFQARNQGSQSFLDRDGLSSFAQSLGARIVPLVKSVFSAPTLEELQEISDNLVLGAFFDETPISSGARRASLAKEPAEGIVVRPRRQRGQVSTARPLGFKIISRNYKD